MVKPSDEEFKDLIDQVLNKKTIIIPQDASIQFIELGSPTIEKFHEKWKGAVKPILVVGDPFWRAAIPVIEHMTTAFTVSSSLMLQRPNFTFNDLLKKEVELSMIGDMQHMFRKWDWGTMMPPWVLYNQKIKARSMINRLKQAAKCKR